MAWLSHFWSGRCSNVGFSYRHICILSHCRDHDDLGASGHISFFSGLLIYSLIVTGNVDYLARVTLMKKIGNVHPLVTVFGVIVGLNLFGFMGFIFGPLIFSYSIILIKIYSHEFVDVSKMSNLK